MSDDRRRGVANEAVGPPGAFAPELSWMRSILAASRRRTEMGLGDHGRRRSEAARVD